MKRPILQRALGLLEAATTSRSPFSLLQLATVDANGAPQLRTVVLRRFDPAQITLAFVTDARSPKIRDIETNPRVALVAFDPSSMLQLRLSGHAAIVDDAGERSTAWEKLREGTRSLFDANLPPGTVINADGTRSDNHEAGQALTPYDRFALIVVVVSRLEWLDLSNEPHLRVAYERSDSGWREVRLAP